MKSKSPDIKNSPATKSIKHPLIGLYFLSFRSDGKSYWQGFVLDVLKDDVLLVQLFSWLTGDQTNLQLVPISETLSKNDSQAGWKFYRDHENWLDAGAKSLNDKRAII